MGSRLMFVKTRYCCNIKLYCNKYVSITLVTQNNWINWMGMSVNIWEIFQWKRYYLNLYIKKSSQELLDSRFCYERPIVLLLYAVSSVATCCISIKPCQTLVNIQLELLKKKSSLDISGVKFKKIIRWMGYFVLTEIVWFKSHTRWQLHVQS